MGAICKREFISLIKSIRAILIVIFIVAMSIAGARLSSQIVEQVGVEGGENPYVAGMNLALLFFGFFFVFSLSHDVINREIHERTVRFLVTKTSRKKILYGKLLGVMLFWLCCLFISNVFIAVYARSFDLQNFLQSMSFVFYAVTLAFLLSIAIPNPRLTIFVGIFLAIMIPILSIWSMFSKAWYITWLKYLTPYYYLLDSQFKFLIILLFGIAMTFVAGLLFERRDFS